MGAGKLEGCCFWHELLDFVKARRQAAYRAARMRACRPRRREMRVSVVVAHVRAGACGREGLCEARECARTRTTYMNVSLEACACTHTVARCAQALHSAQRTTHMHKHVHVHSRVHILRTRTPNQPPLALS